MPISAPDVQQGWSSHQLPGARYFILTHKPKPHKWLIAVTAPLPLLSSYWHWSRQILIETLIGTERLVCCQEGTRTPHHLQTAAWNNGEKKKAVKKFAHIEAFRLSYKGRGNKTLPQILDSHIQHEHNRLFSPRCEEWSCPALFSWPDNHYKSSKFPTKYQRLQGVSNS